MCVVFVCGLCVCVCEGIGVCGLCVCLCVTFVCV